ncbi:MAG: hypothetical protein E7242_01095 [Lachnospiraceae bacterium]|nr:hypothetical protein [Lachnospiraceae bacterium]
MRAALMGICFIFIFGFSTITQCVITDVATRCDEVKMTFDDSVRDTMQAMLCTKAYSIDEIDDFMADFIETFMFENSANSKFKIEVSSIDAEAGIANVQVSSYFKVASGKWKQITVENAVVFNQW